MFKKTLEMKLSTNLVVDDFLKESKISDLAPLKNNDTFLTLSNVANDDKEGKETIPSTFNNQNISKFKLRKIDINKRCQS